MKAANLFPNLFLAATLVGVTLVPDLANAAGRLRSTRATANPDGGLTAGHVVAARGPQGGGAIRGRAWQSDGSGNGTVSSAAAVRGPNGARAARAGTTTHTADGTLTHQSAMAASGAKGSVTSSGNFTHTDERLTQTRTTTATATATGSGGKTYQGSTSYDKADGLTHSGSCTDAAGNSVTCR